MSKEKMQDLYLQWFTHFVVTDAVAGTTVVERNVPTGMSARGGFAWLVHKIEWRMHPDPLVTHAGGFMHMALSTRPGLADVPTIGDTGLLGDLEFRKYLEGVGTNSSGFWFMPVCHKYLPPMIIAPPTLSLYVDADAAHTGLRCECRVGYTTVPLDSTLYVELAETWGLV